MLAGCADAGDATPELSQAEVEEGLNPQYETLGNAAPGCQLEQQLDDALRPVVEAAFGGAKLINAERCQEDAVTSMAYVVPNMFTIESADAFYESLSEREAFNPLRQPEYEQTEDIITMVFEATVGGGQYTLTLRMDIGEQRIWLDAAQP